MAFHANPIVDSSAERSEESVLRTKLYFSSKAGFISRDEKPDYGVDLNVELVSDKAGTGRIFPIQIKSALKIRIIEVNQTQYVSIDFKTSRLGYLCRRPPAYGIIVIYDDATQKVYFDFVEDIYQRLLDRRDSEAWKTQDDVAIHVPLQELTGDSVKNIHERISKRFDNADLLLESFGRLYTIPSLHPEKSDKIDFNNPRQIEELLIRMGFDLFGDKSYPMLVDLIERLPTTTISRSNELALLAAITYGQLGMMIESDYYLQKADRFKPAYTPDQVFLLDYTRQLVSLRKGDTTTQQFHEALKGFKQQPQSTSNMLTIEINLVFMEFVNKREASLQAIEQIFETIENANLSERDKSLMKLFNLENLHNYGTQLFMRLGGRYQIQQKLGVHVPMEKRIQFANQTIAILEKASDGTRKILKDNSTNPPTIVTGFAAYYQARFFFAKQFHFMMMEPTKKGHEPLREEFQAAFDIGCYSVPIFWDLHMLNEVHQSLSCVYELQYLHQALYGTEMTGKTISEIRNTLREVESATGTRPYESIVEQFRDDYLERIKRSNPSWTNASDEEINQGGQLILEAYGIPQKRLIHIIAEIKAIRRFGQACTNPDLELLFDKRHFRSGQTLYATPPIFFIYSKNSGIQSKPSTNIEDLLDEFSSILKNRFSK